MSRSPKLYVSIVADIDEVDQGRDRTGEMQKPKEWYPLSESLISINPIFE